MISSAVISTRGAELGEVREASRTSPNSAPRVEITADEITRHPRWATSPLSEVQINCEQHSRSPGAQCPEASLATRLRYARELHLVINPDRADHTLVIWVHQLEVGEKSSPPGTDTTRGLSCHSGGEASPPLWQERPLVVSVPGGELFSPTSS